MARRNNLARERGGRPTDLPTGGYRGETYYGLPSVKSSPWHGLVSTYIYVAGLSGSAQVIATLADLCGGKGAEGVVRRGRHIALLAPIVGAPLLIADLHTPQRFYNMLRIFRATSPMSIGTYLFSAFSLFSGVTAVADFFGATRIAKVAQIPAALAGAGISTYTAALLAATSTPLWAAAPRLLAIRFASSAVATGAAALSLAEQVDGHQGEAVRRLDTVAMVATAADLVASMASESRYREVGVAGPLEGGTWGAVDKFGALAIGAALPLAGYAANLVMRRRSPTLSVAAGLAVLAGGLMMRHAILEAGNESAKRPRDYFRFTQPRASRGRGRLPVGQPDRIAARAYQR